MRNTCTFIGKNVTIGKRVCLGENVRIIGHVDIGDDVVIGENAIIGYPGKEQMDILRRNRVLSSSTGILDLESSIIGKTKIGNDCMIYPNSIICAGVKLGEGSETYVGTFIGEETRIGKNASVRYGAQIYRYVQIGDNATISGFCCNRSKIGNNVSTFGILIHKYKTHGRGQVETSPVVEDDAVIGWNAIIIGGVIIGKGAYVCAGSIVTKNVEPNEVVRGLTKRRDIR